MAALTDLEVRVVQVSQGAGESEDGTYLFRARERALTDVPPERVAATILITDGQVHDAPGAADEHWTAGPVHVLLTGKMG